MPYPDQLTAASDAVMQYAFSLNFKPENIILFSWSIGGFAVSWLANQYPNIKGVVSEIKKLVYFFSIFKDLNLFN